MCILYAYKYIYTSNYIDRYICICSMMDVHKWPLHGRGSQSHTGRLVHVPVSIECVFYTRKAWSPMIFPSSHGMSRDITTTAINEFITCIFICLYTSFMHTYTNHYKPHRFLPAATAGVAFGPSVNPKSDPDLSFQTSREWSQARCPRAFGSCLGLSNRVAQAPK